MFACGTEQKLFSFSGMFHKSRHKLKLAGLFVGSILRLYGGDFTAPAEGPVAFRRDQVPLDVVMMGRLSQGFSVLADESAMKTAFDRRGVAQMLALAVALDPANTKARSLIDEFSTGRHKSGGGAENGNIESHRLEIWQSIEWLETAKAEGHGEELAACLKDVVIFFDPQNPRAQAFRDAGERGNWAGWVPPLAAYEMKETPITQESLPVEVAATLPPLTTATLATLLGELKSNSDRKRWVFRNTSIKMSAKIEDADSLDPNTFNLVIGSPAVAIASSGLTVRILKLLSKQHSKLPLGVQVTLEGKGLDTVINSRNSQSISGALVVLASAAATGRELGNVTVIGKVDAEGTFSLPADFWTQLLSLGPGSGGRLVLPAAAAEYIRIRRSHGPNAQMTFSNAIWQNEV